MRTSLQILKQIEALEPPYRQEIEDFVGFVMLRANGDWYCILHLANGRQFGNIRCEGQNCQSGGNRNGTQT